MHFSIPFRLALPFALIALVTRPAAGQAPAALPDRWQLTLNDHEYIWDVRLVKLAGDSLIVRNRDSLITASVANIAEIRLLPETILLVGDGHHSAISAMAGGHAGVFDLASLDLAERKTTIQKILSYQGRN